MNDQELEQFVELLYLFILKKIKEDSYFKNSVKNKNATVLSVNGDNIEVIFPYDTNSFIAINKSGEPLSVGDTVCIQYWIDLKNAVVQYKVNV